MANATVRFNIDTSGFQESVSKVYATMAEMRTTLLRIALATAKKRERRVFLNMLRSTRRKRREAVRKWQLAKLHVKACEIRIECPTAEVRIVSRRMKSGEPIVMIDAVYARGENGPSGVDRRTILLGHRARAVHVDECPIEVFPS
jgi:hypothetical protein